MALGRAPALVGSPVDVAVIACEIAAVVDLQNELAEQSRHVAGRGAGFIGDGYARGPLAIRNARG